MESKEQATLKLRKWKVTYFVSLLVAFALFLLYAVYAVLYTPDTQRVLLNQHGAIYSNEDLGETNVTEGQVKQFAYEAIRDTFNYNFVSFLTKDNYAALLSGERESDMPDHRDSIRPHYSDDAYKAMLPELESAPWMSRFHSQRRQLKVSVNSPPTKENSEGFVLSNDGRLNIAYKGYLFVLSTSKNFKTQSYRVDYRVELERKPILMSEEVGEVYYFKPMVPINTFEWRIKSFTWTAEQRS